jgi:hypothetical protein
MNSEDIAYLAGQGDVLYRLKLSNFNKIKALTNTTNVDFRDVVYSYQTNAYPTPPTEMVHVAGANGIIYSTTAPNPAGQPDLTTTCNVGVELNAITCWGSNLACRAVGKDGAIFYGTGATFTRNYSVFGPRLNDVHFASSTVGTVVGNRFFVRTLGNAAAPTLWTRILPSTINGTNLTRNVTDVATKLTVSPATPNVNYAVLGGDGFMWRVYAGLASL